MFNLLVYFLVISITSFILSVKAEEEFLRVEDDLRVAFPEDEGDCNITTVERILDLSFLSALLFTIPGGLLIILVIFSKIFGIFDNKVRKRKLPSCLECFLPFAIFLLAGISMLICTAGEFIMSCLIVFGLRKETACLREDDQFEELSIRLRHIIILDSFIIAPYFILLGFSVLSIIFALITGD